LLAARTYFNPSICSLSSRRKSATRACGSGFCAAIHHAAMPRRRRKVPRDEFRAFPSLRSPYAAVPRAQRFDAADEMFADAVEGGRERGIERLALRNGPACRRRLTRAGWDRFMNVGDSSTGKGDVDVYAVGVGMRF
jgi:hypothetical protein